MNLNLLLKAGPDVNMNLKKSFEDEDDDSDGDSGNEDLHSVNTFNRFSDEKLLRSVFKGWLKPELM